MAVPLPMPFLHLQLAACAHRHTKRRPGRAEQGRPRESAGAVAQAGKALLEDLIRGLPFSHFQLAVCAHRRLVGRPGRSGKWLFSCRCLSFIPNLLRVLTDTQRGDQGEQGRPREGAGAGAPGKALQASSSPGDQRSVLDGLLELVACQRELRSESPEVKIVASCYSPYRGVFIDVCGLHFGFEG